MIKPFMRFQYGVWICRASRDGGDYISWHTYPLNTYLGWVEAKKIYGGLK